MEDGHTKTHHFWGGRLSLLSNEAPSNFSVLVLQRLQTQERFNSWSNIIDSARPGCYSSSAQLVNKPLQCRLTKWTYLPCIHLVLLQLVLLHQLIQQLLQPVQVRPQRGKHFGHRLLYQHAIDHSETLSVFRKRVEGVRHQPGKTSQGCQAKSNNRGFSCNHIEEKQRQGALEASGVLYIELVEMN